MSVSSARIASAARSPEIRASWYAVTAASVAFDRACAWSSAFSRSASETNGTPPASFTCASDFTRSGIAELFSMFPMKVAVTAAIITEPAIAVPSDAPRFVIVFWIPPTSGLSSSGTAETVTDPSWEASDPTPSPISSIGRKTTSGPESGLSAPSRTTVPRASERSPSRTTRRGLAFGRSRGIPIAAARSVIDSGSSRAPVASAESPRQTER